MPSRSRSATAISDGPRSDRAGPDDEVRGDRGRGIGVLGGVRPCRSSRGRAPTLSSSASSGRRATATTTPCCGSRSRPSRRSTVPRSRAGVSTSPCSATSASRRRRPGSRIRNAPSGDVVYGPLHDLVGGAVARELTMGGREIDAAEALRLPPRRRGRRTLMPSRRDGGPRRPGVRPRPREVLLRTKARRSAAPASPPSPHTSTSNPRSSPPTVVGLFRAMRGYL